MRINPEWLEWHDRSTLRRHMDRIVPRSAPPAWTDSPPPRTPIAPDRRRTVAFPLLVSIGCALLIVAACAAWAVMA